MDAGQHLCTCNHKPFTSDRRLTWEYIKKEGVTEEMMNKKTDYALCSREHNRQLAAGC